MSSNLNLALWLRLYGGDAAAAGIRKFTAETTRGFGKVSASVRNAWKDLNGFSTATRLLAAAGGLGVLKNILSANLDFHKNLLEMKQTGEMSVQQMAGAKAEILKLSTQMLQTPQEMLEGLRAFTTAGEKYEFALAAVGETARTATAFFSRPVEIANMDVDLKQKMGLRAEELKDAHNMLLYHARSGRYETKAMSMDAPRTLNTLANAGLTGMEGVNLMGSLTQRLMQMAPTTQPSEVATYMEHFLGHLTQPHYVKGLKKAGIDVKRFMPQGKFGGVDASGKPIGGQQAVDSFLAFLEALRAKGLNDPFQMGKAGFREMYTSKAAMKSLQDVDELRKAMGEGTSAAKNDLVGVAFAEIKEADFGRIKAAEVEIEKSKLGDAATRGTGAVAGIAGDFANDPGKYLAGAAGIVGLGMAWRMGRNRQARLGGGGVPGVGGAPGGVAGVQPVFVTNFPGGGGVPGAGVPGVGLPGASTPAGGAGGAAGKTALGVLGMGSAYAGAALIGGYVGYEVIGPVANQLVNAITSMLTKRDETLGSVLYDKLHEPIKVEVSVQNGNVVASVNEANVRRGLRY